MFYTHPNYEKKRKKSDLMKRKKEKGGDERNYIFCFSLVLKFIFYFGNLKLNVSVRSN